MDHVNKGCHDDTEAPSRLSQLNTEFYEMCDFSRPCMSPQIPTPGFADCDSASPKKNERKASGFEPRALSIESDGSLPSSAQEGGFSRCKQEDSKVGPQQQQAKGHWTDEEHHLFLKGFEKVGRKWRELAMLIPTRNATQVRTHAQKYFQKLRKANEEKNKVQKAPELSPLKQQTFSTLPDTKALTPSAHSQLQEASSPNESLLTSDFVEDENARFPPTPVHSW
eukprot:CAMPEP_0184548684 /NCGR_PEP_ID=MMETSP0199_2-20130426/6350_1 /TAXON_ID=1112570 /ORGANISM="Thraustochytrium sp., Strain LLF1b" /LENGTH=223 /DNA_ID=CAMNT_0026943317 /DNA_START=85 /DNA_END=753 /DNA_ORIENTATION=-